MTSLGTEREITKFFAMASINLRPDACAVMLEKVSKHIYSEEKREFLNRFLKYFKEWQSLNQRNATINKQVYGGLAAADNAILDNKTAVKIIGMMNLNNSLSPSKRQAAPFAGSAQVRPDDEDSMAN